MEDSFYIYCGLLKIIYVTAQPSYGLKSQCADLCDRKEVGVFNYNVVLTAL